jgi:hypothetical protein
MAQSEHEDGAKRPLSGVERTLLADYPMSLNDRKATKGFDCHRK